MKKKLFFVMMIASTVVVANAQTGKGGIDARMLQQIEKGYEDTPANRAIRNAIGNNDISALVVNQDNQKAMDTNFSIRVKSKGITNQASSGRCWLFTGLNVMRAKAIEQFSLPVFEYSQVYSFFYDQLEKANLFLQGVIDTRHQPMDDKMVEWLFQHPLSDGGTFCGVADLAPKYGLVPSEVMPETFTSENTSKARSLVSSKLREFGLQLRDMVAQKKSNADIQKAKTQMLTQIYRMLKLTLGAPVEKFTYAFHDKAGRQLGEAKEYTPLSFYKEVVGDDIKGTFIMVMNDPRREYYKTYEVEYDRHTYDGSNWRYLNLPMEEIEQLAIASLKDGRKMYSSYDVGKLLDRKRGYASLDNFDYGSVFGTTFAMDKAQRISTFDSGSTHAMTLTAVDLDKQGKPIKWKVENSWGATSGQQGCIIMTAEWFREYMFRLVVNKKYVSEKLLKAYNTKPVMVMPEDPLFLPDE
jgi:bleomycin hydrolase